MKWRSFGGEEKKRMGSYEKTAEGRRKGVLDILA